MDGWMDGWMDGSNKKSMSFSIICVSRFYGVGVLPILPLSQQNLRVLCVCVCYLDEVRQNQGLILPKRTSGNN